MNSGPLSERRYSQIFWCASLGHDVLQNLTHTLTVESGRYLQCQASSGVFVLNSQNFELAAVETSIMAKIQAPDLVGTCVRQRHPNSGSSLLSSFLGHQMLFFPQAINALGIESAELPLPPRQDQSTSHTIANAGTGHFTQSLAQFSIATCGWAVIERRR